MNTNKEIRKLRKEVRSLREEVERQKYEKLDRLIDEMQQAARVMLEISRGL